MPLREMLDLKTSEILGNEMVGGRLEILQEGRIGPSSERGGQGVQGADHEIAIESREIAGENEALNEAVNEVTETEELTEEIGIETETGGIKKQEGRKAGETKTKTEGKGTGNGIGQEVVLPKGIQPVPANRPVLVTAINTKRVNEKREREVKIRTEITSKKR